MTRNRPAPLSPPHPVSSLDIIVTAPSVAYQVTLTGGEVIKVDSPAKLPSPNEYTDIEEPMLDLTVVAPSPYVGALMELMHSRRSEFKRMESQTAIPRRAAVCDS